MNYDPSCDRILRDQHGFLHKPRILYYEKGSLFYLHGNRGSMEQCRWEIEPFSNAGYQVWTMDYRGFGESQGAVSENKLLGDATLIYNKILKTDEIDIILGRSFGSGIATYLATIESPKRLVLETPYWSLPDAGR